MAIIRVANAYFNTQCIWHMTQLTLHNDFGLRRAEGYINDRQVTYSEAYKIESMPYYTYEQFVTDYNMLLDTYINIRCE